MEVSRRDGEEINTTLLIKSKFDPTSLMLSRYPVFPSSTSLQAQVIYDNYHFILWCQCSQEPGM